MEFKVFDDLVNQENVIEVLKVAVLASRTSVESQEMSHAWIFTGPPGSGRSSAAVAFAQALICPHNACGNCQECMSVKMRAHPDVEMFTTEGLSIKVEAIRELLSRVAWAPSKGGWRVVVIEDADRLTESAANALLKIIEEPGNRTVWLLCAPTLHDVLSTIRSRCRHLQLRTPSSEDVTNILIGRDHIAPRMADFAARVSQGHIGRAKYIATNEQARINRKKIMKAPLQLGSLAAAFEAAQTLVELATNEANEASQTRDFYEIKELQEAYGKGATGNGAVTGAGKAVKELEQEQKLRNSRMVRDSIDSALLDIATFFRDVIMVQTGKVGSLINIDMGEQVAQYAENSSPHSIIKKINAIMEARISLARNAAPLLTCETLMCRLAKQ